MSLVFCSLSSGSSGNCQYIGTDKTKFLIDAGHTGKRIEMLLEQIKVKPEELDGILVTHEHRDHVQSVGVLARRHKIPVFATAATWQAMEPVVKKIPESLVRIIDREKTFAMEDVGVFALPTHHDAVDPTSFILEWEDKKLSLVTDTGWLSPEMLTAMEGSDVYFLEANYDEVSLRDGTYPWHLKQRIQGTRGHLSNVHAGIYLQKLLKRKGEKVILAHLSQDNNKPKLAFDEVAKHLQDVEVNHQKDYVMTVAKRYDVSAGVILEK